MIINYMYKDKIQTQIDDERNARVQAKTEQNLQHINIRTLHLKLLKD